MTGETVYNTEPGAVNDSTFTRSNLEKIERKLSEGDIDTNDLKFLDSFVGQFYPFEILNELKDNGFEGYDNFIYDSKKNPNNFSVIFMIGYIEGVIEKLLKYLDGN